MICNSLTAFFCDRDVALRQGPTQLISSEGSTTANVSRTCDHVTAAVQQLVSPVSVKKTSETR